MGIRAQIKQRLDAVSIFYRIVIGNGAVIVIGAVAGTLITSHLAGLHVDMWLIGLFSVLGTVFSVFTNTWIIKNALAPVYALVDLVRDARAAGQNGSAAVIDRADPEIKELAAALRSLVAQLEAQNERARALSHHVIIAQEEERKRIARGLHDDTGQALSMLLFNLQSLEDQLAAGGAGNGAYEAMLHATQELAARTLNELRQTIYGLRPSILDDLGLLPAIRWYARTVLEPQGVQVFYEVPDALDDIPQYLTTTLFRITQEAVNNIEKHAAAREVTIALYQRRGRIYLQVSDNGRGFDVGQNASQAVRLKQLGLVGIRERVELVGGEVFVDSTPGSGTCLRVNVQLPAAGENGKHGNDQDFAGG